MSLDLFAMARLQGSDYYFYSMREKLRLKEGVLL